jgi:hypothetical protein
MSAAWQKVAADFCLHTRQSEEDAANESKVAQKWLAVHATLAPSPLVYAHVASDYALVNLRTHNPPLHAYTRAPINVEAFVFVTKHGFSKVKPSVISARMPSFLQFCQELFPRPVGEELWEEHYRGDTWKPMAYFLALNASNRADFYPLVEAIYTADLPKVCIGDKDAAADLYTRIVRLKIVTPTAEELGQLLTLVDLKEAPVHVDQKDEIIQVNQVQDPIMAENPSQQNLVQERLAFAPMAAASAMDSVSWEDIRRNPFVQTYRKNAGLAVTYSPQKLVKQMILSRIGLNGKEPVCASLLGTHQTKFPVSSANLTAEWSFLMDCIDAFETDPGTLMNIASPSLVAFSQGVFVKPTTRGFLRQILSAYVGQSSSTDSEQRRLLRFLKAHPQLDKSIINTIVKL